MIRFLEANGYDTEYWSGVDTDRFGGDPIYGLQRVSRSRRIFLSVGHDEVPGRARSAPMSRRAGQRRQPGVHERQRDVLEAPLGTSIARLRHLQRNHGGRKIDSAVDSVTLQPIWTGTWRDTRFGPHDGGRPENALIGSIWTVNCCTHSIIVPASMAGLRLWRNTPVATLTAGSRTLGKGTLGYEWGEALENGVQPAGLVRLSSTTVPDQEKIQGFGTSVALGTATHSLTLYRHNSGAIVFGASTVQWSWGLDAEHDNGIDNVADPVMQQATVNLFADMGAQPSSLRVGDGLVSASQSNDSIAPSSTITSPIRVRLKAARPSMISGTANDRRWTGGRGRSVGRRRRHLARCAGQNRVVLQLGSGSPGPVTIRSRAVDDSGNLETPSGGVTVSVVTCMYPCASLWRPTQESRPTVMPADATLELGVQIQERHRRVHYRRAFL